MEIGILKGETLRLPVAIYLRALCVSVVFEPLFSTTYARRIPMVILKHWQKDFSQENLDCAQNESPSDAAWL
jgi:hypothetical protein